jgi:hypothetical protein
MDVVPVPINDTRAPDFSSGREPHDGSTVFPAVAVTHHKDLSIFEVGKLASDEIAAIAVDGDQLPLFYRLRGARGVTHVVDIGRPITPRGIVRGTFTDSMTFEITARPGDRLSLATMLICTNDGFTGLRQTTTRCKARRRFARLDRTRSL